MSIKEKLLGKSDKNERRGLKQMDKALKSLAELGICVQEVHIDGEAAQAPNVVRVSIVAILPLEMR